MKREVLFIEKDELLCHFGKNVRQDVKIVTPAILTEHVAEKLRSRGKTVKQEEHLKGNEWTHSSPEQPNKLCEATDFDKIVLSPMIAKGPFSISFANRGSVESLHFHNSHWEIYYSEYKLETEYKLTNKASLKTRVLKNGGAILFSPGVCHKMTIGGLTIIIETPAIIGDREEPENNLGSAR